MKYYILLLAVFLSSIGLNTQDAKSTSFNLYGGYTFSDIIDFDLSHGTIKEGLEYGVGIEYFIEENSSVELKYL